MLARRPYFNIFALVDELDLDPFTPWTRSQQWSPHGLEVDAAILQVTSAQVPSLARIIPWWCKASPCHRNGLKHGL